MNNLYENDNGILGNVQKVIEYIEEDETIDLCDYEHILIDLKDILKDTNYKTIVLVNDNNGMGYTIDYWEESDIIGGQND